MVVISRRYTERPDVRDYHVRSVLLLLKVASELALQMACAESSEVSFIRSLGSFPSQVLYLSNGAVFSCL